MNKLLSVVVAAAFAASSFGALAQDKKKEEVKSAAGAGVTTPAKGAVTTATEKPEREKKGVKPEFQGKRKDETQRTDKK